MMQYPFGKLVPAFILQRYYVTQNKNGSSINKFFAVKVTIYRYVKTSKCNH